MFKKIQNKLIASSLGMGETAVKILKSNKGEGASGGVSTMVRILIIVLVAVLIWGLVKLFIPDFWATLVDKIKAIA